jgi:hypothetical protein
MLLTASSCSEAAGVGFSAAAVGGAAIGEAAVASMSAAAICISVGVAAGAFVLMRCGSGSTGLGRPHA